MSCHCGVDHHSGEYTDQQRADLDLVLGFNRRLADAIDECRDVAAVEELLDPDPLRYMWVDEGAGRIPDFLRLADQALADAPALLGHRRAESTEVATSTGCPRSAARPSVATDASGRTLHTWLEWEPDVGDRVLALVGGDSGEPGEPVALVADPVDCFRPTACFDAAGRAWVAYGRSSGTGSAGGEVAVYCRRLDGGPSQQGNWGPEEAVSDTAHPSFNQELAAHADGGVEVCWQGREGGRFGIWSRRWQVTEEGGGWGASRRVSVGTEANVWDPSVASLPDGGSAYAWTEYRDGSYRVVVRTADADGTLSDARPVTGGTDYALHPSLAVTADGAVWCAFDVITVQGHGGSGPTRLRPAAEVGADPAYVEGMRPGGDAVPPELRPEISASIRVVRVDGAGFVEMPGDLAPGLDVVPGGLPRLVAGDDGALTVAYRVHRRLPLMTFYWEVAVQRLGPAGWRPPTTVRGSDGTLEEPAVAAVPAGVLVAFQSDGRLARGLEWTEGFGGRECPDLLDHHGAVIWHGMQRTGSLRSAVVEPVVELGPTDGEAGTEPAGPVPLPVVHSATRRESRSWAPAVATRPERYATTVGDTAYQVWWGDLHRHSLISRCTAGDEPSLEDFYRYAWDVCEYDFWAVTDHSENSTEYQWWSIQKIADLFLVPGRFVPLYGFEWTGLMGHQNVIFGDVARGAPIFSAYAEGSDTPAGLWDGLASHPEHPAVTIPHHPGSAMVPYDWDYHDPRFLRLAEVFQACRGNYEDDGCFRQYSDATRAGTFTLDGLRRGHRFGLVCSSDHGNGASYVGAYAESLDRESIFTALQQRRVFAATTRDVLVDFRVSGIFMGSEGTVTDAPTVEVYARGYGELARIDILRNGVPAHSVVPRLDLPDGWRVAPVRVEWGLSPVTADWSGSLRVEGGGVVQTAYWSPEVVGVRDDEVRWVASTKSFGEPYGSQRGAIEVTLVGPPDAVVSVTTAHGELRAPLREVAGRVVPVPTPGGGRLRLQPGVGGLVGLGANEWRVRWTDPAAEPTPGLAAEPTWYYARVFQTDGEMAWSSPVWLDWVG